LEAIQASASSLLTPCHLASAGGTAGAEVLGDASAIKFGPVRLVYVRSAGAGLNVQLLQPESFYDINFALEGVNRIETLDEQVALSPRRAGIISPQTVAPMQLSDGYSQLHVRIERSALERHLERMLDGPVTSPVRFGMEMDLTAPAVASWARVIQLLVDDLDEPPGLTAAGAEASPWSEFLMSGFLLAQPHNYSERLARTGGHPASAVGEAGHRSHRTRAGRRRRRHGAACAAEEFPRVRGRLAAGVCPVGPAWPGS
jgi:hypothetical protein